MRILVAGCFDSFLRAGTALARGLCEESDSFETVVISTRTGQLSERQASSFHIEARPPRRMAEVASRSFLAQFDVVLMALNGTRTRRFLLAVDQAFGDSAAAPVTVSFYPGVIFRFQLEGMASRMSADLLLLNSREDQKCYQRMLQGLGTAHDNSMALGLSFLPTSAERGNHRVPENGPIVFFGQPTVPAGELERRYVLEQFVALARRFPTTEWLIKPRHRPDEMTLHRMKYHYEELAQDLDLPDNLRFSYESMSVVLDRARGCATFSSTAAIEAMSLGIPTRIITDLGIHENLGNHYFLGSAAFSDFSGLRPDLEACVDPAWLADRTLCAADALPALRARLQSLVGNPDRRAEPRRLFGRAPEYDAFVEATAGVEALEDFGDSSATWRGRANNLRRRLLPVSRELSRKLRQVAPFVYNRKTRAARHPKSET